MARTALDLVAEPIGTVIWSGFNGYQKTNGGLWTEIASGPQLFTSAELARILGENA